MQVRALFFASYRDLVGEREIRVDLPEASTVEDLVRHLRSRGDAFTTLPASPTVAVNRTHAGRDAVLRGGDEVAFLPPVAGG